MSSTAGGFLVVLKLRNTVEGSSGPDVAQGSVVLVSAVSEMRKTGPEPV